MSTRYPLALLLAGWTCLDGCREHRERTVSRQLAQAAQQESIRAWSPDSGPTGRERLATDSVAEGSAVEQLDPEGRYIDSVFRSEVGESPQMGWFLSTQFIAAAKHARVYIYSTDSLIGEGVYQRTISSSEHERLTHEHQLACDSKGALAEYRLNSTPDPRLERAFYTSKRPAGIVHAGLSLRSPTTNDLRAVTARLAVPQASVLYRDTVLAVSSVKTFYSVFAAYDSSTHGLLKSALILHDSSGRIVAYRVKDSQAFECDGCGAPRYEEGLNRLYGVINAFYLPGFAYPVLLLDTGTVEGRALSFVTFTSRGVYSEYRIYEYVATCILGDSS